MDLEQDIKTKEKILYATIDLFSEKGFGNVSVREIAQRVGIKASSLYKHYDSKEALLESIFSLFKGRMKETSFPGGDLEHIIKTMTPEEYLDRSFELFKQVMWTPVNIKISKIITMEQQRNHSVRQFFTEELIQKPNQMMKHVLDFMMKNGAIGKIDTVIASEEYNSYIIYLYFEQNFLKESPDLEEIERKMKQHNKFFARQVLNGRKGET